MTGCIDENKYTIINPSDELVADFAVNMPGIFFDDLPGICECKSGVSKIEAAFKVAGITFICIPLEIHDRQCSSMNHMLQDESEAPDDPLVNPL